MQSTTTAILVCSCDKYEDVWLPFFTLLFRYWPERKFPVFLLANKKTFDDSRVKTIATPESADWSTCFQIALRSIAAGKVIVLMEDYLLDRRVDDRRVGNLIEVMEHNRAACMHLYPDPPPDQPLEGQDGVGVVASHPFRVNLQAAVWDRASLLSLVRNGESAWDFEVEGTKRSMEVPQLFLSVDCPEADAPFHYYRTGVVRGLWMPDAVRLCEREGIKLDLGRRRVGWFRGFVRDYPLAQPLRRMFVSVRRRLRIN